MLKIQSSIINNQFSIFNLSLKYMHNGSLQTTKKTSRIWKMVALAIIVTLYSYGLCSCGVGSKKNDEHKMLVNIERYDRLEYRYLTTGDFSALQEMNTEFPIETRMLIEDILKLGEATDPEINAKFLKYYQDTTLQTLLADSQAKFANMEDINRKFNDAFTKLKKWFPDMVLPRIYTQVTSLDQSIVIGNHSIGISLDKYLGANYPLYEKMGYNDNQRKQMERKYILPDGILFYLLSYYHLPSFDTCPQEERDIHLGKMQWIVNHAIGTNFYKNKYVAEVDNFMKRNPKTSYDELIRLSKIK